MSEDTNPPAAPAETVTKHSPPARLTLFGHPPRPADVDVLFRPRSWRATRSLLAIGIAIGISPVVGILPPHLPWIAIALGVGGYLAFRRWTERYTLRSLTGECPKCGAAQAIERPVRLRRPHPLYCGDCGYELLLEVDVRNVDRRPDSPLDRGD